MSAENETLPPIPGLDVVGHGVYLKSRQPYELKATLFNQQSYRPYFAADTDITYKIPQGYDINESPPVPTGVALNRLVIEQSIERLDKKLQYEAAAACGIQTFTVDATASQTTQVQRNSDAYYASRISFIPFYTVYISDLDLLNKEILKFDIPTPFRHAHRKQYEKFFDCFGSHFVKRAWVGGKANLTFSVLKSANISENDIRAGIKASYGGLGNANVNTQMQEKREQVLSNSECIVSGKGGDSIKLAALGSMDAESYNAWLATIKVNPQVLELEVTGIWTLFDDEAKANALKEAYKEASTFTPVTAIFSIEKDIYFIRNRSFSTYNIETGVSCKSQPLKTKWPELENLGFDIIDATLSGDYIGFGEKSPLSGKVFFFSQSYFVEMDTQTHQFSQPQKISEGWPGVPFERIDAALHFDNNAIYLFSGNQYIRFNLHTRQVDPGYPQMINQRWSGVNFDKIDAAIYWGDGKAYFLREDQHIRYDVTSYCADSGYPKHMKGSYADDWNLFV